MSLTKNALRSAGWSTLSGYANIIIGFIGNIVLARILFPDDFGVYSLASSILTIVFMIGGFGSQEAIVQCRDELIPDLIPTAFWISILIGVGLSIVGTLVGLIVRDYYLGTVGNILIVSSWLNLLVVLGNTYSSLLQRNLTYGPIALFSTGSGLISFVAAGVAAFLGAGPWSLVIRQGLAASVSLVGLRHTSGYRLPLAFNWTAARWIWDFGWRMMISRVTEVIYGNVDNLVVGSALSTVSLGHYSLAYRLAFLGQQFTQGPIQSVMLSAFAAVQNSSVKLQYGLERMNYWLCRSSVLLGLGVLLLGKDLVTTVYGVKWELAGVVFQHLFLFLAVLPLHESHKTFLIGAGRINAVLKARIVQLLIFLPALLIAGILKDLIAAVWAVNLSLFISWLLMSYSISNLVSVNWAYLLKDATIAGLTTFLIYLFVNPILISILSPWIKIVIQGLIIVVIYGAVLMLLERKSISAELALLRRK